MRKRRRLPVLRYIGPAFTFIRYIESTISWNGCFFFLNMLLYGQWRQSLHLSQYNVKWLFSILPCIIVSQKATALNAICVSTMIHKTFSVSKCLPRNTISSIKKKILSIFTENIWLCTWVCLFSNITIIFSLKLFLRHTFLAIYVGTEALKIPPKANKLRRSLFPAPVNIQTM